MVNLGLLETSLNSDSQIRQEFLKDPIGLLRREGLVLSMEQERQLREAVAKLQSANPGVGGASIKEKIGIIFIGG
jgi:hypothetical protein